MFGDAMIFNELVREFARQLKLVHEHLDRIEKQIRELDRRLVALASANPSNANQG